MRFSKLIIIVFTALLPLIAKAEVRRFTIGSGQITPCSIVELKQLYNATIRTAPQEVTAFADIDTPNANNLKNAIEQCIVLATTAAGLSSILANPPATAISFDTAFYSCAKAKAAELASAKITLGVEPVCKWSDNNTPAAQVDPLVSEPTFNADFYLNTQNDLNTDTNINGDLKKVTDHWKNAGVNEGRRGSRVFDPIYYLHHHSDLITAYGNNFKEATLHWITYGLNEGRASSEEFDVKYYLSLPQHEDLLKAFGVNGYAAAAMHWVAYGLNEGRRGSQSFDVKLYLSHPENGDLRATFGDKAYQAAFDHWIHFGKKECNDGKRKGCGKP